MYSTYILFSFILSVVLITVISTVIIIFIKNKKKDYLGNIAIYFVVGALMCLMFSLLANFIPAAIFDPNTATKVEVNWATALLSSFFNAAKMVVFAFDASAINAYFSISSDWYAYIFPISYMVASLFGFFCISVAPIFTIISFAGAKIKNLFKLFILFLANLPPFSLLFKRCYKPEIYLIFSDSKVSVAAKLAEELRNKNKKDIVIMYVTRGSMKTQDGTEYKNKLVAKDLDVRTENFNKGLASVIVSKWFGKGRVVKIYGLFSDDETSIELANSFKEAILDSRIIKKYGVFNGGSEKSDAHFNIFDNFLETDNFTSKKYKIKDKVFKMLNDFKVFITYHESDFDVAYGYSKSTGHIINTLSEYDIISSEFLLNNSITNFVDLAKLKKTGQNNKSMNVTFLGFGKINKPIFEMMSHAYQLWGDNINKVNYHILDKNGGQLINDYKTIYTKIDESNPSHPYLYSIDSGCNGEDLRDYLTLHNYLSEIENDNKNRFNKDGFEIFVVSVCDTNTDVNIAINLRHALFNVFKDDEEKLSKTIIFVRVANSRIIQNFKENDFIVSQDLINEGYLFKKKGEVVKKGEKPEDDIRRILVPVVMFGENALMSEFLSTHYNLICKIGIAGQKAYISDDDLKSNAVIQTYKIKNPGLSNEEIRQMIFTTEAERRWYVSHKKETNKNTAPFYTIETKLDLLGYDLDKYEIEKMVPKKKKNKSVSVRIGILHKNRIPITQEEYAKILLQLEKVIVEFETLDRTKIENDDSFLSTLLKIREIEHNRWLALESILSRYTPASFVEEDNLNYNKGETVSKSCCGTKNICMITNKALDELEKVMYQCVLKNNDNFDRNKINNAIHKLVFGNDIKPIFTAIEVIKEENM